MIKREFVIKIFTILGKNSLFRLYDIFTILLFSLYTNILAQEKINNNLPIDLILLSKYTTSLLSIIFFYLIYHKYKENFESACRLINDTPQAPSELYKDALDNDMNKYVIYYICFIFFTVAFVILKLKF
ncbi:MAG: hypothetical protein ABIL58_28300 [Pseudomonadota bacterium]